MAQFFGAPPMALMTVGTGTLLLGKFGDRPARGGRRRLGAVVAGDDHRPDHRGDDPVSAVHPARRPARRGVRRLADAGRPADGVGGQRRAADLASRFDVRTSDVAVWLLRDVRPQSDRRAHHHHPDLEPPGALRDLGGPRGSRRCGSCSDRSASRSPPRACSALKPIWRWRRRSRRRWTRWRSSTASRYSASSCSGRRWPPHSPSTRSAAEWASR